MATVGVKGLIHISSLSDLQHLTFT